MEKVKCALITARVEYVKGRRLCRVREFAQFGASKHKPRLIKTNDSLNKQSTLHRLSSKVVCLDLCHTLDAVITPKLAFLTIPKNGFRLKDSIQGDN